MVLHMKLYVITLAQDWTNFVGKNQTMSAHCVGGFGFSALGSVTRHITEPYSQGCILTSLQPISGGCSWWCVWVSISAGFFELSAQCDYYQDTGVGTVLY